MTVSHRAQGDGQVERTNGTIKEHLRATCLAHPLEWDCLTDMLEIQINNQEQAASKHTPFFVDTGYHAVFPGEIPLLVEPSVDESVERYVDRLDLITKAAKENLKVAQERMKRSYDSRHRPERPFVVGDLVWLNTPPLRKSKLGPLRVGPYAIIEATPPTYRLNLEGSGFKGVNHFNASSLTLHVPDPSASSSSTDIPMPTPLRTSTTYEVDRILDHKVIKKSREGERINFKIRWKDFDETHDTWEPLNSVCPRGVVRPTWVTSYLVRNGLEHTKLI